MSYAVAVRLSAGFGPTVERGRAESTVVQAMDPQVIVQLSDAPELRGVADDAVARLRAALDGLSA